MSIVNDALKKAGKEFETRAQDTLTSGQKSAVSSSDKKWTAIITVSLILIALLFGSLILYKNMGKINPVYTVDGANNSISSVQSALDNIEQKNITRPKDVARLSGIVYGEEGKWAIVNNKIVKEGDSLFGGEIISITRDIVKIQKKDGSEIILSLK